MASSRKKQDENNLKTLRELGALPQNKFCFDCGQRGPTYVNVTIGSFVCTKCSGILRGLTPPHRVKSISMATFTTEEIDTIRTKGNDYCRNVWLGLYEETPPTYLEDEQKIRDFMIEKYERKRYYLEKGMTKPQVPNTRSLSSTPTFHGTASKITNGVKNGFSRNANTNNNIPNGTISNGVISKGTSRSRPEVKNHINNNLGTSFADFDKADIFSSASSNTGSSQNSQQNGFADFEHNPVYNASNAASNGMPTPSTLSAWTTQQTPLNPQNNLLNGIGKPSLVNSTPPSTEDKYAALKDLDNEMKQQQQDAWSTPNTGSTGSLYSSSTPTTGSVYGSPSPQGSIFGSPSQGQFMTSFASFPENNSQIPNPFGANSTSNPWSTNGFSNGTNGFSNGVNGFNVNSNGINNMGNNGLLNGHHSQTQQPFVNPFREQGKANGFPSVLQPVFPSNGVNGLSNGWGNNPFKVGAAATMNSNNPFL